MGAGTVTGDGTNAPSIRLFNNSKGPFYLCVLDIVPGLDWSYYTVQFCFERIDSGTLVAQTSSMVAGEAVPPGLIYADLRASYPPPVYYPVLNNWNNTWVHDFCFAVLPPGWSCTWFDTTIDTNARNLGLVWEFCEAQDLDGSLAELALKLASV